MQLGPFYLLPRTLALLGLLLAVVVAGGAYLGLRGQAGAPATEGQHLARQLLGPNADHHSGVVGQVWARRCVKHHCTLHPAKRIPVTITGPDGFSSGTVTDGLGRYVIVLDRAGGYTVAARGVTAPAQVPGHGFLKIDLKPLAGRR